MLRVCGEAELNVGGAPALAQAEAYFKASVEIARKQQALAWELRAVMSLAALWQTQGRVGDAYVCLKSVYERFSEGHSTADLVRARSRLKELKELTERQQTA